MANIVSLAMENFRSYKNKAVLSFEAIDSDVNSGNFHVVKLVDGKTIRLLNSAVIYGANAAGKSNVIMALLEISYFIKSSRRFDPGDTLVYQPYKFSNRTKNAPVSFSLDFVTDGVLYEYAFQYNKEMFLYEALTDKTHQDYVFKRNDMGETHLNPMYLPNCENETYLGNHLAMSELSLKAIPLIQDIYRELSQILAIAMTDEYRPINNIKDVAKLLHDEAPDSFFTQMLKRLITTADTGIIDLRVKPRENSAMDVIPISMQLLYSPNKYEVSMIHPSEDGGQAALPLNEESAGTQTLFTAGARVIRALEKGSMLAYDEMNIALHPRLFSRLVELFNNEKTNPNHAQLLVTTHDTTLIDENLLRADQIWFAEKKNGVSDLYSAIDFDEVRIDQPFESWYRAGRLGAIPFLQPYNLAIKPSSEEK